MVRQFGSSEQLSEQFPVPLEIEITRTRGRRLRASGEDAARGWQHDVEKRRPAPLIR